MQAPITTVVPLRSPGAGKSRLSSGLEPDERAALAGAMLADVIAAIRAAEVGEVLVAAGGPGAAAAAAALQVPMILDGSAGGLNAALDVIAARQPGADLLVVQADLPCVTPADVQAMVAADGAVVLAPSGDGGTGALLRRPGGVMPAAFGPDSAARHRAAARARGLALTEVRTPGLALDVDVWDDLLALRQRAPGPATAAVLATIADRLAS